MNYKAIAKNYAIAILAQGVSTFAGIATGFLVPKALGIAEFGYYQLFVFYTTYVGLSHLGLTDGVYLIVGGEDWESLNCSSVKSQMIVGLVYESFFALLLLLVALFGRLGFQRSIVLIALSLYSIVKNVAAYLGYVLQAVNETRKFSISTIIEKGLFLILVLFLLISGSKSFVPYVIAFSVGSLFQMVYCIACSVRILEAELLPPAEAISDARESIFVGSKLLVANLASSFILGIARLAIDMEWGIETFGKVSFSLSLVTFFLTFITQASMVLFPALRGENARDVRRFYELTSVALSLFFPLAYLMYCPMRFLVSSWLPDYSESIRYLIPLLPVCVFESKMNISCTTLYKVRRQESRLLAINLATVAMCTLLVGVSVFYFGSVDLALISTSLAIIARSTYSEYDLSRSLGVEMNSNSVWEIVLTVLFILLASLDNDLFMVIVYCFVYLVFLYSAKMQIKKYMSILRGYLSR